jgi:hypothetical protein
LRQNPGADLDDLQALSLRRFEPGVGFSSVSPVAIFPTVTAVPAPQGQFPNSDRSYRENEEFELERTEHYRKMAQTCCLKAAMAEDPLIADGWLQLAHSWLLLARKTDHEETEGQLADKRPN